MRKDALLALSEMPATPASEAAVLAMFAEPRNYTDRWIPIAVVTAATRGDVAFLTAAAAAKPDAIFAPRHSEVVRTVAEHFARGPSHKFIGDILAALAVGDPAVAEATLAGLRAGWPAANPPELTTDTIASLTKLLTHLPAGGRMQVVALGKLWNAGDKFNAAAGKIHKSLLEAIADAKAADAQRLEAANQLVTVGLDDAMPRTHFARRHYCPRAARN